MNTPATNGAFRLLSETNTPSVVGKAWWNESLQLATGGDGRRVIIGVIGAFVGLQVVSGVCGVVGAIANSGGSSDATTRTEKQRALAMQQQHGWTFGSAAEARSMAFAGVVGGNAELRGRLPQLAADLAPKGPAWLPSYVPTLFQSATATPTARSTEEVQAGSFVALADVIVPVKTPAMDAAATDGRWLKQLLGTQSGNVAVVVDLAGPASVAFAAEVADLFDPVFCFDNWPHPRGVVRAHETLAAAATLQPVFTQKAALRTGKEPPIFVLDRTRLAPYVDEASTFDNRSMARLPGADVLLRAGVKHVVYIAPAGSTPVDLDDVNGDLVGWAAAGLDVRTVDFHDWYDGSDGSDAVFAMRYGLFTSKAPTTPVSPTTASSWAPTARNTSFAVAGSPTHKVPAGFGEVPVVVSIAQGVVLGSLLYRSGSWNRASSSSWSFGGG